MLRVLPFVADPDLSVNAVCATSATLVEMKRGGRAECGGMLKEKYGWLHRPKICFQPPSNMKYTPLFSSVPSDWCSVAAVCKSIGVYVCLCSLPEQNIWQSCPPHPPNLTQAASHLWLLYPTVLAQKGVLMSMALISECSLPFLWMCSDYAQSAIWVCWIMETCMHF